MGTLHRISLRQITGSNQLNQFSPVTMYFKLFILVILGATAYGQLVGGERELTDEEIAQNNDLLSGSDQAVEEYNAGNSEQGYRLVAEKVVKATSQVVAGIKYRVVVRMVYTTCMNTQENSGKDLDDCPAQENALRTDCRFEIWTKSWENFLKVTHKGCTRA